MGLVGTHSPPDWGGKAGPKINKRRRRKERKREGGREVKRTLGFLIQGFLDKFYYAITYLLARLRFSFL